MFSKRRSMIPRGMGATYDDAKRIADRKSIWLVDYLRARRTNDPLRGFFRKRHFAPTGY